MREISNIKFINITLTIILVALVLFGCGYTVPTGKEEISVAVWADTPEVQEIATSSEIRISITNQDKQNIPGITLRSKKLKDWIVNSIRPKPLDKGEDEGVWAFKGLPPGRSLNITLNVTPVEAGHQSVDFTFESKGLKLTKPNGTPASFKLDVSVARANSLDI